MQRADFVLQVFDTDYELSRSDLQRSRFLGSLFSGRYEEKHIAALDLDESLQPAFEIVYDYLVTGKVMDVPNDLFQDVLFVASYLDVPNLVSYLAGKIETLPREVVDSCVECFEVPEVVGALFSYYVNNTPYFADLPNWVQEEILTRETEIPEQGRQLYSRLFALPLGNTNLAEFFRKLRYSYGRNRYAYGYGRRCQGSRQPILLNSEQVGLNTREGRISYRVDDEFFFCPKEHPYLRMGKYDELCCGQARVADDRIRGYKALQSAYGYLVLVPENFIGDYVVSESYAISPQGDVILS